MNMPHDKYNHIYSSIVTVLVITFVLSTTIYNTQGYYTTNILEQTETNTTTVTTSSSSSSVSSTTTTNTGTSTGVITSGTSSSYTSSITSTTSSITTSITKNTYEEANCPNYVAKFIYPGENYNEVIYYGTCNGSIKYNLTRITGSIPNDAFKVHIDIKSVPGDPSQGYSIWMDIYLKFVNKTDPWYTYSILYMRIEGPSSIVTSTGTGSTIMATTISINTSYRIYFDDRISSFITYISDPTHIVIDIMWWGGTYNIYVNETYVGELHSWLSMNGTYNGSIITNYNNYNVYLQFCNGINTYLDRVKVYWNNDNNVFIDDLNDLNKVDEYYGVTIICDPTISPTTDTDVWYPPPTYTPFVTPSFESFDIVIDNTLGGLLGVAFVIAMFIAASRLEVSVTKALVLASGLVLVLGVVMWNIGLIVVGVGALAIALALMFM